MAKLRRLLLVDDEPLIRELFSEILERWGYQVVTASDAIHALEEISRSFFDVVVCDVVMEGFDGFDFLALARQRNTSLGIVLVTGSPEDSGRIRAQSLSARYAEKPIGVERLLTEIDAAIELARNETSPIITENKTTTPDPRLSPSRSIKPGKLHACAK